MSRLWSKSIARHESVRSFSTSRSNSIAHLNTERPQRVALSGKSLLNAPSFNKGTAFTIEERKAFGLQGLLPGAVQTLEEQVHRAYAQYNSLNSDILKNACTKLAAR